MASPHATLTEQPTLTVPDEAATAPYSTEDLPPSVEVNIISVNEDDEWEIDDLIPCCGIGVVACSQNCSFPSCVGKAYTFWEFNSRI